MDKFIFGRFLACRFVGYMPAYEGILSGPDSEHSSLLSLPSKLRHTTIFLHLLNESLPTLH